MTRTLLCFGDSNTHGTQALTALGETARFGRGARWPGILAAGLGQEWHVIEEGHPGRTTIHDDPVEGAHRNGLTVLPSILESHQPLDLVVLMLGTNDLKPRFSLNPTDIALSLERLIRTIKSSACGVKGNAPQILVVSPVPIEETGVLAQIFEGGAEKSRALAQLYSVVARRNDCAFLDLAPITTTDPIDGVHLTTDAHRAIALAINKKINEEYS